MTVEKTDLKALLEQERQARIRDCSKEIERILNEYNCTFDVTMIISARGIIPQIQIVSKE